MRFFQIAEALCRAVGNAIRPGFIEAGLAMRVVLRIQRVRRVLLALETLFLVGVVVRRVRRGAVPAEVPAGEAEALPVLPPACARRLPRRLGWLCPLVPGEAACFAEQLRQVLAEPGIQALLACCPQAVRAVAPLCRMLGIARADFVPGHVDPVRVKVVRVRRKRVRPALIDPVLEDAHYAFSGVPRRLRLWPLPGRRPVFGADPALG